MKKTYTLMFRFLIEADCINEYDDGFVFAEAEYQKFVSDPAKYIAEYPGKMQTTLRKQWDEFE